MKQCIIFSRVSTASQLLDSQTKELKAEASRLGYSEEQIKIIEYKESAIKLSIDERKGIQALKYEIEKNSDIDCVIIYEISRLSRQETMLFEIRDWLIERQIQLVCMKPYMRLLENGQMSQTARILFSLFSSISESEMMIKKERMMRGKKYKQEQNRYVGGWITFGYKVGKDQYIEIDNDEADVVRKIFKWYDEGRSMIWIARELIQRGSVAHKWHGENSVICCIKHTLRRREYIGAKTKYQWPRIISDELFNSVQSKITKNKVKYITHKQYLGQGLIRLKEKNLIMSPNERCYQISRIGMKKGLTLNTKLIEEWIWNICEPRAKTITNDKRVKAFLHDQQVLNNKIHVVQDEIKSLNIKIDKINDRIVSGRLDEAKGDMMIENTELEIEKLNTIENELTNKLLSLKPDEVDLSDRKAVVRNEIEIIDAYRDKDDEKIKILEVHFKDGTIKKYRYKSWSRFARIE